MQAGKKFCSDGTDASSFERLKRPATYWASEAGDGDDKVVVDGVGKAKAAWSTGANNSVNGVTALASVNGVTALADPMRLSATTK
mmetsp:Transcript_99449/g.281557  ORF Transcript_99449/g.281557 Transcript_99449/m.281557 type:complete len:85 (+) Transcript_99449:259-513(+)